MKISQRGVNLIKAFEGYQPEPYICPAGLKTIGYGHVILKDENFEFLNHHEAENLLKRDLHSFEKSVNSLTANIALKQNQFDALVSFSFNVGSYNFAQSTLLKLMKEDHFADAANEFGRWVYANKKILPGLVSRRGAEKALFLA